MYVCMCVVEGVVITFGDLGMSRIMYTYSRRNRFSHRLIGRSLSLEDVNNKVYRRRTPRQKVDWCITGGGLHYKVNKKSLKGG